MCRWMTRHLISHDSLQGNTTIEIIVQALHFCAQRNEVFFRFGWRENDSERFHSSGRHKKETKRSSTSIFLQKVCRNLYFTMNFQFTVYKHVEFNVYKCISLLFCYVYKVRAAKNFFFSSVNIFSFRNNRASSQY